MVAKVKYTPLGETLSVETAYVQAALALDVAAQFAVECKDVEGLNTVASLYMELGTRLVRLSEAAEEEDDEVDHEALERKIPLGFRPIQPELIEVEGDDDPIVPAAEGDIDE